MRWAVVVSAACLGACVSAGTSTCPGSDALCPDGSVCREITLWTPEGAAAATEFRCVLPADVDECAELLEDDPCTAVEGAGQCHSGVCFVASCGNHLLDLGEVCDDADGEIGDGCTPDCQSNETCGNGVVDPTRLVDGVPMPNERCDDGDRVPHDGCSAACDVEQPRWTPRSQREPNERAYGQLVFDTRRQRFVGFGGTRSGVANGETFVGSFQRPCGLEEICVTWSPLELGFRPPQRFNHAMAYDSARDRVVMFGGELATSSPFVLGDLWELDGDAWRPIDAPDGPQSLTGPAMAYDPIHRVTVLYGGSTRGIDIESRADTYEWSGTTWQRTTDGPEPLTHHSMAFDPVRGVIVLVGQAPAGDRLVTWHYDAVSHLWVDVTPAVTPPVRTHANLAWDATAQQLLLFGGQFVDPDQSPQPQARFDSWWWDGDTWTPGPNMPQELFGLSSAADPERGCVVGFGGAVGNPDSIAVGSSQVFTGTDWETIRSSIPSAVFQDSSATAYDSARDRQVFLTQSATVELAGTTWMEVAANVPNVVRPAIAYDAGRQHTVVFGGKAGILISDDTWTWDGVTWTLRTPANRPPGILRAAMVYDEANQRLVLFGGELGANPTDAMYAWDGNTWVELSPPTRPSARTGHVMGYDRVTRQIVLFGGNDQGGSLSDTWVFADGAWTEVTRPTDPIRRTNAAIAWNNARRRLVLFGGLSLGGELADTWEWDGQGWAELAFDRQPDARASHALLTSSRGVMMVGGALEVWEHRWESREVDDSCRDRDDADGDGRIGCDDPECRFACAPSCVSQETPTLADPEVTELVCAPNGSSCGDGACDPLETCRICPADCACLAVCGDGTCEGSESITGCPGDCSP